ncbi:MAG: hypothetical protein KME02_03480 [Aphanothece saxicola GSE-SYN-MK-01-06B]|nr:hypothetical protein [Aphanothece saxicola GSE-SYN-MK-01-06B]
MIATDSRLENGGPSGPLSSLASILLAAALALGGLFVLAVVAGALPVQVLQRDWQQRFIELVIANSGFPLVGFVLVHLAAHVEPERLVLFQLRQRLRRWAVLITVLYLLLIPLQLSVTVRQFSDRAALQAQQRRLVSDQFSGFAALIRSAPDAPSLQRQLAAADGPTLSAADLAKPMPQLRQDLLAALRQAEAAMPANIQQATPLAPLVWAAFRDGLRLIGSALLMAVAFAAGAQDRTSSRTLLTRLLMVWRSVRQRRYSRK